MNIILLTHPGLSWWRRRTRCHWCLLSGCSRSAPAQNHTSGQIRKNLKSRIIQSNESFYKMKTNVTKIHKPPTLQAESETEGQTHRQTGQWDRQTKLTEWERRTVAMQADKGLGYTIIRWCKEALILRSGPSQIRCVLTLWSNVLMFVHQSQHTCTIGGISFEMDANNRKDTLVICK